VIKILMEMEAPPEEMEWSLDHEVLQEEMTMR
jgi:hypothetical protein